MEVNQFEILVDDVRLYNSAQDNLFLFIFTSIGAILSFAITQENPYFSFAGFMLLIPVRCRHIHYRDRRSSLVAYMSVFVAPKEKIPLYDYSIKDRVRLPERRRGRLISKLLDIPFIGKLFKKVFIGTKFAYLQYFSYSTLAFGCVVSYFFHKPFSLSQAFLKLPDLFAACAIVILLLIVVAIDLYYIFAASKTFDIYIEYWTAVKQEIESQAQTVAE